MLVLMVSTWTLLMLMSIMNKKQFQSLKYRAILVILILLNSAVLSAQENPVPVS
jgi:hypothetical protein